MGALENEFQISQEWRTQVKSSWVRFHFLKFEAFEVCFLGLP